MNSIFTRRSVRDFVEGKIVEKEKVDKLIRAAMQAPSARNQQPWEFIVIDDKETILKVKDFSPYGTMLERAPLCVIILERTDTVVPYYTQQDLGACMQNLLLEVVEQGLGACWMGVERFTERDLYLKDLFKLPEGINAFGVVAIGYPAKENANKFTDRFDETRVHYNKY